MVKELTKILPSIRLLKKERELNEQVNKSILWQKNEVLVNWVDGCKEFIEDRTQTLEARVGHEGFLIVTNQRIIFTCKNGPLVKDYEIIYSVNLEDVISVSQGKFGFNDKLVILEKRGQHRDFIKPEIQLFVSIIKTAISKRKNELKKQKKKEGRHVKMLDFTSLKEVMSKRTVFMSTYKNRFIRSIRANLNKVQTGMFPQLITAEKNSQLLHPSYKTQPSIYCPTCGKPATWIQQYSKFYCFNCKKDIDIPLPL